MKLDKNIEPFRAAIESLNRLLKKHNYQGVIIGGVAVGLLGKPRFTADVDAVFLLSISDVPKFLESAKSENIETRVNGIQEFAKRNRVLPLIHTPTDIEIDISMGIMPFEIELVERASEKSFSTLSVRLPTPEDLIIMKAVAHRPKDLEDIRTIIDKNPDIDTKRIKKWVTDFSEVLEKDLWKEIEEILKG
ncbi:MAG: nucleotidyltransferase [Anaerolineales bacterium]|nr:nucleotidyltransferase [Anaerolineales bacterium]